ncbi:DUF305 domain-containing protein [Oricola indica]|uniref:DUF305 domain-containing protein n=1 Tax=Oricola indica TaxID=2872591 RepID=UPI003CCC1CB0
MSYIRFGLMILTSTLVMFILMYLNTYAFEHVFFSETRAYMAVLMGATMAFIMLGFMLGMYRNTGLNIAIFIGAILVFAGSLWLVRSQVTVSGPSYMRAMIPHHSIAVMTSERAGIEDSRARKLADEIIAAQRREIAEMRYLIADISAGNSVDEIYRDPPTEVGTVADALANTLVAELDPAPVPRDRADEILGADGRCAFNRGPETDPILWTSADGNDGVMKLNGVIVPLSGVETEDERIGFEAPGVTMTVRPLGEDANWRSDAELVFALEDGPTVGYRGFYACGS